MIHNVHKTIAAQLGETQYGPVVQIRRIVQVLGAEVAQATADEALAIEAAGGMLLPDGVTRRTVGGIFFRLIRDRTAPEIAAQIFPSFKPKALRPPGEAPAPAPPPQPALPAFRWTERQAVYQELRSEKGILSTMKVTLIGRPGRIVEKQDLIITMMEQSKAPTSFPKGVPTPPSTPTTYTLYISKKQWNRVAEAMQNPEDALIVEGWAAYDPSLEGVAVFVSGTTTKLTQQQKRQAQPTAPSEG